MRRTVSLVLPVLFVVSAVSVLWAALLVAAGPAAADPPVNPSDAAIAAAAQARDALAAQLGSLQAQAVQVQAQIDGLQDAADTAIATYEQTTRDVAAAIDAAEQARTELVAANAEVARTRSELQVIARDTYVGNGSALGRTASLLFAPDPSDVDFSLTAATYLAGRTDATLRAQTVANVAAANAESTRRASLARAEELQRQADVQQAAALTALETARVTEVQLTATLADVNARAATASAALSGLLDQRAAYDAYLAEVARAQAARREAARQAAIRSAQAQAARAAASGPSSGSSSGSGSGSGSGSASGESGGSTVGGVPPRPVDGGSWVRPLTSYRISSCYCQRGGEFHGGVDLAAPLGTPIYAVGAGTVVRSGPASGFGNWVVVDHHDGTFSVYGHMRVLVARVGQQVGPGTLIAYVGTEGESTGPHLHFAVRIGGPSGPNTNPLIWLRQRGVTL